MRSYASLATCTGCQWSSESTTSWPSSSTSRCVVKPHCTWLTTASLSLSLDADSFARLMPTSSPFREHHSTCRQELLSRGSQSMEQSACFTATAWHWIWTVQTTFEDISVLRHRGALVTCWFWLRCLQIALLTYLLTWWAWSANL